MPKQKSVVNYLEMQQNCLDVASSVLCRREESFLSHLMVLLSLTQPRKKLGVLWHKSILLAHVHLVHQEPQILLCKAAFQPIGPNMYWCMRLFQTRCRTRHSSFMNFTRCLSALFSNLLTCLWMAAQSSGVSATSSFVSSAKLLSVTLSHHPDHKWAS